MRKLIVFCVLVVIAVVGLIDTNKKDVLNNLYDDVTYTLAIDLENISTKYFG